MGNKSVIVKKNVMPAIEGKGVYLKANKSGMYDAKAFDLNKPAPKAKGKAKKRK
jgi:hypothetical protein